MPLPNNDRKEELSYAYVHTLAARAGFSCDRPKRDRQSMDILIHSEGPVSDDSLFNETQLGFQLKATAGLIPAGDTISFSLPIKNYNDLRMRQMVPRLLVLFVMPQDEAQWLQHEAGEHLLTRKCAYYLNLYGAPPVDNDTSRTVHIPRTNVLTMDALNGFMAQASRGELNL
ncbi:DUF4365 domain-containing protein [Silvibacterium sp.]|uniref:DUF4365 domain-containing protein n=1 Tax=Silvibacterium sp. TaxID=1964179 RepID=UPI0039E221A8